MTNSPRTVMAFDFGLSQIGIAVGNTVLGTTQALGILKANDGSPDWSAVSSIILEWQPQLLVVGSPINMDGTESALSARADKFARRLHGRFGMEVTLMDERLSSFEAKQVAREAGHKGDYKARPIDGVAAELILKSWLSENT